MRISINPYDKSSITAAEDLVRQYKDDFRKKEQEFLRRLAEVGATIARVGYSTATDYSDSKEVIVRLEQTANGYSVLAEGEIVGFLEFGTGIRNREWDNTDMPYTPPPHGSYGKGKGKQPWGWWFYPREGGPAVHTYGETPVEAMRLARDEMIANVTRIAREVWR